MNKYEAMSSPLDLSCNIDTSREQITLYVFNHVAVSIDRRGKNVKNIPELMFGTFDETPNNDMLNAPTRPRENVSMDYIVACIQKAIELDGSKEFWIHPHGKDASDPDHQDVRQAARLKLYRKYADLIPDGNDFGYILKV